MMIPTIINSSIIKSFLSFLFFSKIIHLKLRSIKIEQAYILQIVVCPKCSLKCPEKLLSVIIHLIAVDCPYLESFQV